MLHRKIAKDDDSVIENVRNTRRSFELTFKSREELLRMLMSKLRLFEEGADLLGQLNDVTTSLDEFFAEQKKLYGKIMKEDSGAYSHTDASQPI
ncbi:hypothetical protein BASA60_003853 [Batrachochytrium salamandrivorans]|nr:hypothetical protein BASA60_003853 [Batrachochytrium salamandrivorans]